MAVPHACAFKPEKGNNSRGCEGSGRGGGGNTTEDIEYGHIDRRRGGR